jgi:hypothetical protein
MINFIGWIMVGGLVGWIASMFMRTTAHQGMLLNIVVGDDANNYYRREVEERRR